MNKILGTIVLSTAALFLLCIVGTLLHAQAPSLPTSPAQVELDQAKATLASLQGLARADADIVSTEGKDIYKDVFLNGKKLELRLLNEVEIPKAMAAIKAAQDKLTEETKGKPAAKGKETAK